MTQHPIAPCFDENSKILVLGSFPSVRSREEMFFYGHPQNRFWKLMASIFDIEIPSSIEGKKRMLLSHGIALWDVIASCDIVGSSDPSIKNAVPTDLSPILRAADIEKIIVNGRTAEKYYNLFQKEKTGMDAVCLPSTSPANASWSLKSLIDVWRKELINNR